MTGRQRERNRGKDIVPSFPNTIIKREKQNIVWEKKKDSLIKTN